jgi:type I phosphodiesterase/nucleotide pyrophosphatase
MRARGSTSKLAIVVLIDALGWQFVKDREFLNDRLTYRQPLQTILGFSSGAIPTILTGVFPAQHGHWNLFYYDPERSPFRWLRHFQFLPKFMLDHRLTRKVLKEIGRRILGLGHMFECCVSPSLLPYFNWVEKRDLHTCGAISGAPSIFDTLSRDGVPYRVYSDHLSTDKKVLEHAQRDLQNCTAWFYFLYLREVDGFLHEHCNEDLRLTEKLAWYAAELRKLFDAALKLDPQANFTIISDHGMTPVRQHYDLIQQVESLGFTMPLDYLAVYDSTMARFWFFNERARHEVVSLLNTLPCGRVLPDKELELMGVLFPDRRYGEVVMLLDPGWLLSRSDFNGPQWVPVGMHGYHPADPYSDAVLLSNHEPPVPVRTIADVHSYMEAAAGLVSTWVENELFNAASVRNIPGVQPSQRRSDESTAKSISNTNGN